MGVRLRHLISAVAGVLAVCFSFSSAEAASLEKIEVGSRLGEPFVARIPLNLEEGEVASKALVEVASPGDYRIFEVYREPVVDGIRADVNSDEKGAWVTLTSPSAIQSPFFNLVLKLRYGRVSHFKKFPVVLETAEGVQIAADKAPVPVVDQRQGQPAVVETPGALNVATKPAAPVRFDGWARTKRYGPIVRGDSLYTIASRLRVDSRYTKRQVMVALFEKNRDKFDKDNLNLLKAGSYLDVPTAAEVEKLTPAQAAAAFSEHEARWKELTRQPRYAAEAEAQRTRYGSRVGMEQVAGGTAAASSAQAVDDTATASSEAMLEGGAAAGVDTAPATDAAAADQALLAELKQQNERLQEKLAESDGRIADLSGKIDELISAGSAGANNEKLELMLAQSLKQLEQAQSAVKQEQGDNNDWMIWVLVGLVGVLVGVVTMLMLRREPTHPAAVAQSDSEARSRSVEPAVEEAAGDVAAESEAATAAAEVPKSEEETPEVFNSIDGFADELTDTDTAELHAFDPSLLDEEPDPDVDYLSEAEVYTRYGMHEEALHQLEMALKLNPANTAAHLKKAELLNRSGNEQALEAAVGVATAALAGAELERYMSGVEALAVAEDADASSPLGDSKVEEEQDHDFDFTAGDLAELAKAADDSKSEEEAASNDEEALDWLHDSAFDSTSGLHAEAAEPEASAADRVETDQSSTQMLDHLLIEFGDDSAEGSAGTDAADSGELSLDSMLGDHSALSFAAEEGTADDLSMPGMEMNEEDASALGHLFEPDDVDSIVTGEHDQAGMTLDLGIGASTMELDALSSMLDDEEPSAESADVFASAEPATASAGENIIGEFEGDSDEVELPLQDQTLDMGAISSMLDDSEVDAIDKALAQPAAGEVDLSGQVNTLDLGDSSSTMELDKLLSEFESDDEDLFAGADFGGELPQMPAQEKQSAADDELSATRHLDLLLDEFSDSESEGAVPAPHLNETIEPDDITATMHLDSLVSEFAEHLEADDEPEQVATTERPAFNEPIEHGATQELDALLTEFISGDDEDEDPSHGATQELGHLLGEFTNDEDEDEPKKS